MLQLHYFPGNASLTPHLLLEELGVPFELKRVDRNAGANKSPEYLKLNPNGQIPVLVDGDLVLYETAAILLHLVDTHPGAALAPAVGTPERAEFYKWLVWLTNTPQAMLMHYFYPERMVGPANAPGAAEVKAQAEFKVGAMLEQLDAHFAAHRGPWMRGGSFSALDPYTFMICRWTRGFGRPARALPHIRPFIDAMSARPAVQKVMAREGLAPPFA